MNQHKQKSGAQALWLSALTAEAGRCILTSGGVSARGLILQGLPVAMGISLAAALLQTAEQENDVFSGRTFRDRVVCGGFALWFAAELWETVRQAQELCWEQFSSMAVLGILPLLVWAGWKLEERVFFRAAGILWWAAALAVLLCVLSLKGQLHWENLLREPQTGSIRFPLYAEYFAFPLLAQPEENQHRTSAWLPLGVFGLWTGAALGMELLFGAGTVFPGYELLRAGALGLISRFDAVFLLVWLAAALFRVCFLVHLLRRLLGLVWNGRRQEVQG